MPGVVDTRAAFRGKHEVVDVVYDVRKTKLVDLLDVARKQRKFACSWVESTDDLALAKKRSKKPVQKLEARSRPAKTSDQLFYLNKSPLSALKLEAAQARRANSLLAKKLDPRQVLSPKQRKQLQSILQATKQKKKAGDKGR